MCFWLLLMMMVWNKFKYNVVLVTYLSSNVVVEYRSRLQNTMMKTSTTQKGMELCVSLRLCKLLFLPSREYSF